MTQEQLLARMRELYEQNLETARRKNDDYAGAGDAFKNFRGCERHGISLGQGILVRMEDKMARLGNLLQRDPSVVGESVLDTALDLANYAVILAAWYETRTNDPEPAKMDVVAGKPDGSADRVLGSPGGTVIDFPSPGDSSKSSAESDPGSDIHCYFGC